MDYKKRQEHKYIYSNYYTGTGSSPLGKQKTKEPKRPKKLLIFACLMLIVLVVVWLVIPSSAKQVKTREITSVIHPKTVVKQTPPTFTSNQSLLTMENAVNSIIQANSNITFEVAITNMNDGSQLNFGQSGSMTAASVSKILTATDFLNQVQLGNQSINKTLDDGNTASRDLQQMIVVSSDSAWAALDDDLTGAQLQSYAQGLGVTSFNYTNNTLSARDTANIMTELYQGKLLDDSNTQLLLGYLKQANYRQYILPAIPSTDTVYHKIGLYNDNVNDATIITNGPQTISLVIFTNGNGIYNWPNRALLMQAIAKPILVYYGLN